MAKGWYSPGTAASEDCQASSGSYNNSSAEAYIGNSGGTALRYYGRFQLDIPRGATIDEARLFVYVNQRGGTVNASITAEDADSAAAYDSNPWNRPVIGNSVAWDNMSPSVYWKKSPDLKTIIQAIVDRSGWAANNYLGLRISADGAASGNYCAIIQSNNVNLVPLLLVSWHTDQLFRKFAIAAASADDTWNQDNDSTGRTAETLIKAGSDGTRTFRAFARFNVGMHHDEYIDTYDGAVLIVNCSAANSTTGFHLDIATLDDESAFPSGSSAYSRAAITGQTPVQWSVGSWSQNVLYVSPDVSNPIQYRVQQSDYDPQGTGDEPYIAIRINEGDANAKNEERQIKSHDASDAVPPVLVVAYSVFVAADIAAPAIDASCAANAPVIVTEADVAVAAPTPDVSGAATAPAVSAVRNVAVSAPRPNIGAAPGNFDVALNDLKHCTDCALDDDGNVYIPEQHHRVIKLKKRDFSYVDKTGTWGDDDNEFNIPITTCCYGDYLYVVDRYNHRIQKFLKSDLSYVSQFGSYGTGDGQFVNPTGITIDGTYIYISDYGNHRIQKFLLSDFSFVAKVGSWGWGNDNFSSPAGLDNDGTYLYIADSYNNRLQKRLLSDLSFVGMCGNVGSGDGQMAQPIACNVVGDYVYMSDHDNNRIVIWAKDTMTWVGKFGSYGSGNDQFWNPAGIHNDGTYLYIADSNNDRVKIHKLSDHSYVGSVHTFGFHIVPVAPVNADGAAPAADVETIGSVSAEAPAADMDGSALTPAVTAACSVLIGVPCPGASASASAPSVAGGSSTQAPAPDAGVTAVIPCVVGQISVSASVPGLDVGPAAIAPAVTAIMNATVGVPGPGAAGAASAPDAVGGAVTQVPGLDTDFLAPIPTLTAIWSAGVEAPALGGDLEAGIPTAEAQGEASAQVPVAQAGLVAQAPQVTGQASLTVYVPCPIAEAGAQMPLVGGGSAVSTPLAGLSGAADAPEIFTVRCADIGGPAACMFFADNAPAVYTQESTVVLVPCSEMSADAGGAEFTGGSLASAPASDMEVSGRNPGIETVRMAEIAAPCLNLVLRAYVSDRVPDWIGGAVRVVVLAGGVETERTLVGGARPGSDLVGGAARSFVLIGGAKKERSI